MSISDDQKFTNLITAFNELLSRQAKLEERLERLERGQAAVAEPTPIDPVPIIAEPVIVAQPTNETPAAVVETAPIFETPPSESSELESKVGLKWLNRIGVVTLVLGVAFFFKWAVDNNWIGPRGRVMLGLVAGFLTLGLADYLWRKGQQVFAQGITGAGIAIVYLSFYAAFDFYHLTPQALAFLLLLATTTMAATLAMRYNAIAIAVLGFFGAYLIPLLLSNGENHPWFLMSYLLALNFASTELAARRDWKLLESLSFTATTLIFGGWILEHGQRPENKAPATVGALVLCSQRFRTSIPVLFMIGQALTSVSLAYIWNNDPNLFSALILLLLVAIGGLAFSHFRQYKPIVLTVCGSLWFAIGATESNAADYMLIGSAGFLLFAAWSWWRFAQLDEAPTVPGMAVFSLNGVVFYALAYNILRVNYHHWLGLLAVAVAASYLAFGMALYRKRNSLDLDAVMLSLGISVAFLTLAIPVQLSGFSITIAWSIQAAALTWIGVRLQKSTAVLAGLAVFALAFFRLLVMDAIMYPDVHTYSFLFNTRFLVFAVLSAALLLSAYWVSQFERQLALVHFVIGHLVMLGGLSLEVLGWADRTTQPENQRSVETISITILFALYAVMLVSIGVARRSGANRLGGLLLIGIVILKLYFYDVWQLGRVYQIIAFVILGVLLLSTSFLYSRFKGVIDEWKKVDKTAL